MTSFGIATVLTRKTLLGLLIAGLAFGCIAGAAYANDEDTTKEYEETHAQKETSEYLTDTDEEGNELYSYGYSIGDNVTVEEADENHTTAGYVAIGDNTTVRNEGSVAIGSHSTATGRYSVALGYDSEASDTESTALGTNAISSGEMSTAVGYDSEATGDGYDTALGAGSTASGSWSTALGSVSEASGMCSTAVGVHSTASGMASTALGYYSTASGNYSSALGYWNEASGDYSVALGYWNTASEAYSVALGSLSVADTASGATGYYFSSDDIDLTSSTWSSTLAAISVGDDDSDYTRQITNLAAGTEDTDAVNVAQLKNLASAVEDILGGDVSFSDDTTTITINNETYNTIAEAIEALTSESSSSESSSGMESWTFGVNDGESESTISDGDTLTLNAGSNVEITADDDNTYEIAVSENPTFESITVNGDATVGGNFTVDGTSTLNGDTTIGGDLTVDGASTLNGDATIGGDLTVKGAASFKDNVSIDGVLNMNGNKITGVADGAISATSTDAINGSQLYNFYNSMQGDLGQMYSNLTHDIKRVGAHAAALASLKPLSYDPFAPTSFALGVGSYRGESAGAIGISHYFNRDALFSLGGTIADDDKMFNASFSFRVGREGDKTVSNETERQMLTASKAEAKMLRAKVAYLEDARREDAERLNNYEKTCEELKAEVAELKAMLVSAKN